MSKSQIVDISHHQPSHKIDWTKAAKEVDLMIIRVQYGSSTIDREYKKHVANCKKHGIPFGHYAYARFTSISDAIVEAKDFLKRADKDAKFLVVDVEEQTIRNVDDMSPATQMFVDTLKNAGWKVGLYTGHHTYKPLRMDKVKADFLWIPRYGRNDGTPTTKPDYPCDIWQYTEKGRVSWYPSFLDLNKLNGSKDLEWFIGSSKKEEVKLYNPNSKALLFSTEQTLKELVKEGIISDIWVKKLQKGELTESEATGLLYVAMQRKFMK
jgi:GH25 family lysozyme M1 (1,4-beta-N-acetylmuramidase)